jgi:hypothetical protein
LKFSNVQMLRRQPTLESVKCAGVAKLTYNFKVRISTIKFQSFNEMAVATILRNKGLYLIS